MGLYTRLLGWFAKVASRPLQGASSMAALGYYCSVKTLFFYVSLLSVAQLVTRRNLVAAEGDHTLFCPCVDRSSTRFSFISNFHKLTSTTGSQLHASVRQAARDRGHHLSAYDYDPAIGWNASHAVAFLEAEISAGTAGIVASLDNSELYAPFSAANAAGIPLYLVGGGDPDLILGLQKREPLVGGPLRASIRYIGPNELSLASTLAAALLAQGVNHLECIAREVDDTRWPSRCRLVQRALRDAGMSAEILPVLADLGAAVRGILAHHGGLHIAVLVEDAATYNGVKASLPQSAGVTVVVYETSVEVLEDIRTGRQMMALDMGAYTQGYLALALASVERHNGQMVTSNIETAVTIYGQGGKPVTDEVMQREVCRAAGNPVCGDPGVLPVTASGCPCFDRADVRYKVVGAIPKQLLTSYHLYQGMADAERDLPGSTFRWRMYDTVEPFAQVAEYREVTNSSFYRGAISFDAYVAEVYPVVLDAMHSVAAAGKPLYLGYMQNPAASVQAFLDKFKGRLFVGPNGIGAGRQLANLARQSLGRHVLIHSSTKFVPPTWQWMGSMEQSYLGDAFAFPPNIWDYPPTKYGNPINRTGAWALYLDPLTNRSIQIMEGLDTFLGEAFKDPLKERLLGELGGPAPTDTLVMTSFTTLFGMTSLALLKELAALQPDRLPVRLMTYKCTDVEFPGLLRWNLTAHEELLLGCMDEQMYLSTYVSAMAAALEQQTGERLLGEVRTERLLRHDQLPLNYSRRVACERANHDQFAVAMLGRFNPLCDVRNGCVQGGFSTLVPSPACSGRGVCQFPTQPSPGTTDGSQGTCVCRRGWTGTFCTDRMETEDEETGHRRQILLAVLLSCGLALLSLALGLLARAARRAAGCTAQKDAHHLQALLRQGDFRAAEALVTVVTFDVDGLADLLAWDAGVATKSLEVLQAAVRSLLAKCGGREVSSDQGAFTLVFYDPVDALRFAMDLQHGLLYPRTLLGNEESPANALARLKLYRQSKEVFADWPPQLLKHERGVEAVCPGTGGTLYRGLRVRMGVHVGVPDAHPTSPEGKELYKGEFMDVAAAIRDIASGGQVLLSMQAWRSLGVHMTSIICHHMGMHQVKDGLPPIHLMQVLPVTLAKRAPFPPLRSVKQLGASFFDAPAAECYVKGEPPTDPVVIAFMYVASAKTLRKTPGFQSGVNLLVAFVQARLRRFEAYEVEEKEGNFLLAFRSPACAVQFAEAVQREMMALPWSRRLLEEEPAAEVIRPAMQDASGSPMKEMVAFRGLRLQIGMCMDVPSDCRPHMATGRAAYFGPVVNRAARIAATAAPGQTLVNQPCYMAAKDQCGPVLFKELGQFDLKVRNPCYSRSWASLTSRVSGSRCTSTRCPAPISVCGSSPARSSLRKLPSPSWRSTAPHHPVRKPPRTRSPMASCCRPAWRSPSRQTPRR
eukprot:jgi/Mesvir1/12451/Mv00606-RA.1